MDANMHYSVSSNRKVWINIWILTPLGFKHGQPPSLKERQQGLQRVYTSVQFDSHDLEIRLVESF